MSFYTRNRQAAVSVKKTGEEVTVTIMKDENGCMGASQSAQQASSDAWNTQMPQQAEAPAPAPSANDMIKAHKAAADAHMAADSAHQDAAKPYMDSVPAVAAAHMQQAKSHFNSAQMHQSQARDLKDSKTMGYRS